VYDDDVVERVRQWYTDRDMDLQLLKGIGVGVLVGMVLGTAVCSILLAIKLG
jgi:hypothetical protein